MAFLEALLSAVPYKIHTNSSTIPILWETDSRAASIPHQIIRYLVTFDDSETAPSSVFALPQRIVMLWRGAQSLRPLVEFSSVSGGLRQLWE
jgi:hypothetical protein